MRCSLLPPRKCNNNFWKIAAAKFWSKIVCAFNLHTSLCNITVVVPPSFYSKCQITKTDFLRNVLKNTHEKKRSKLLTKLWKNILKIIHFVIDVPAALFESVTKLSKLTRLECSPSRLWTLFLGFAPVLPLEAIALWVRGRVEPRSPKSKGLGDVVPVSICSFSIYCKSNSGFIAYHRYLWPCWSQFRFVKDRTPWALFEPQEKMGLY